MPSSELIRGNHRPRQHCRQQGRRRLRGPANSPSVPCPTRRRP